MDFNRTLDQEVGLTYEETNEGVTVARSKTAGDFKFGIEEEYFLADANTFDVAAATPRALFEELGQATGGRGGCELLQAQVEVATAPTADTETALADLIALRKEASRVAAKHDLAILAAGTHPTATWRDIHITPGERYDILMDTLQILSRRNMLCGMHVHVELPDPDQRVNVMARLLPYIPIFIALSTSSPFWQSVNTGMPGYRLTAYDELPRTGLPELFRTTEDYDAYVSAMVKTGAIKDASHIWWTVRPSLKYPTLELRAPDCCTNVKDALAIASLYRVLVRHLALNKSHNSDVNPLDRALALENKWRAQRFGIHGSFATKSGAIPVSEMQENILSLTQADAEALGCQEEVAHCRRILTRGTSADHQLALYAKCESQGHGTAVRAVVEWIAEETVSGV